MFNKYKFICKKLKINHKSDLSLCIGMLALMLVISIILTILVSLGAALIAVVLYLLFLYFHLSTLIRKYNILTYKKQKAFIVFYETLINYLKMNISLIESLNKAVLICDEILIDDVNELILDLQNDQSLQVFLKFSDNFEDETIKKIILFLHKFTMLDNYEYALFNIEEYCDSFNDETDQMLIKEKAKSMDYYKFIPLILSSLSVILIFAYIFSSIGEIVNG